MKLRVYMDHAGGPWNLTFRIPRRFINKTRIEAVNWLVDIGRLQKKEYKGVYYARRIK